MVEVGGGFEQNDLFFASSGTVRQQGLVLGHGKGWEGLYLLPSASIPGFAAMCHLMQLFQEAPGAVHQQLEAPFANLT